MVQVRTPSAEDGYIARRTESGHSLGSLQGYADEWNAVDLGEVSSNPRLVQPHPAGLSSLSRQLHEANLAADGLKRMVQLAHKTAKVKSLLP